MNYEEALRKCTLLLRKADGTNSAEESAAFAAKAQEIMDRYNIEKVSTEYETAYQEGYKAGQSIQINRAKAGIAGGGAALGN